MDFKMNQRIVDIAMKANDQTGNEFDLNYKPLDAFLEKFAELIVRECAQRCEKIAVKHQVEETTYAAGKKAGAFECATDLLQHFGVE